MFKYSTLLLILLFLNAITKSQPFYKVDYARIESFNFLTNQYEENISEDYKMSRNNRELFAFYKSIKEISIISDKKLKTEGSYRHNVNLVEDYDHDKFYILESLIKNTKPYKLVLSNLTWNTYKLDRNNVYPSFISLCNFKNNLIVVYDAMPIRVFLICRNSQFKAEDIVFPENIYSLLSVEHIDPLGKSSEWIDLDNEMEVMNSTEYMYLFKDHVIFRQDHTGHDRYNKPSHDRFDKLQHYYNLKYKSANVSTYEKPSDDGKLLIKTSKNSALDKITIDYIKANEYLRYEAKKISIINNASKSDMLYYQKILNSITINHLQHIVNSIPTQDTDDNVDSDNDNIYNKKTSYPGAINSERKILKDYSFTSYLEKATIYAVIKVSPDGEGQFSNFGKRSTTTAVVYKNAIIEYLKNVQFEKTDHESTVTIQVNFKESDGPKSESIEEPIFTKVQFEPSFPGGDAAWKNYLKQNLNSKIPVINGASEGTYIVYVKFIVRKDGSISDVNAETKHGFGMEDEAVKIIKLGPKWTPALQNGRNVNAYRRQQITFFVKE